MHKVTEIKAARSVTDKFRLLLDDLESYSGHDGIIEEVICECPDCGESFYEEVETSPPEDLSHWIPIIRDLFLEYVEDDEMLREIKRQLNLESEVSVDQPTADNRQGEKEK